MSLYDAVRDLPLEIEGYELDLLELQARPDFLRKTTVVRLDGGDEEGIGEDVTYDGEEHDRLQARGPDLPLAGSWTLHSFSEHLATLPLFEAEPAQHAYYDYRRWAFESAALDLALRQAGRSLGHAIGRERSTGLVRGLRWARRSTVDGAAPRMARAVPRPSVQARRHLGLDGRARRGARGDGRRGLDRLQGPVPRHRRRHTSRPCSSTAGLPKVCPTAWLEDPGLTDETTAVLEPHRERVTWDAIIHSVEDIEALPWVPRTVNVKPSRFGSVERLFAAYDYCEARGIGAYGGGQWELGTGRGHIQLLAALNHPSTPNDVAPREFNLEPQPGLPSSPLTVTPRETGFLAL